MRTRRPALRVDPGHDAYVKHAEPDLAPQVVDQLDYPHTSTFRSRKLTINVRSASVKMSRSKTQDGNSPVPIFGDRDHLGGTVGVDNQINLAAGRLSLSFEGVFSYISTSARTSQGGTSTESSGQFQHVFFSETITLSSNFDSGSPRSTIRDAFASTVRRVESKSNINAPQLKKKLSKRSLTESQRTLPFEFHVPQKDRVGEELPPTFSSSTVLEGGVRGRGSTENADVSYRLVAVWEPHDDGEGRDILEVPVLFQPDNDFQSLDALTIEPDSWLEIPLRSDRPIPCQSAITLPSPADFPRFGSLPFFVVFSTTPKSPALAREIAADATITVSLLRQVTIDSSQSRPSSLYSSSTPPTPPSSATEDSDSQASSSLYIPRKNKLFRRVVRSAPPVLPRQSRPTEERMTSPIVDKPLPNLPIVMQDTRTLQTDVSIGFPKRPRSLSDPSGHGSIESHKSLPDGLYKGKLPLNKSMLPTIDWAGLSVRYYLDVSVLFGQDEMRARLPVRLY
ncbi:hypothetical protein FA95DRAFT_1602103 [Auriscalpium vulgare]|uniref:Uncharacterized protein n=1 Tax=Auriscalpium vulgare TaxID=40419 RepID=A0ACB8S7K7_9AGAM|nr:hypothetical protein FA95DRAFT_1602103 [Auriscalpium vulgare]